jgi:uncharacterized membrane protein
LRSLQVHVPLGKARQILSLAEEYGARFPVALRTESVRADDATEGDARTVLLLNLPNSRVGAFIDAVAQEVADAAFVLLPVGTLPLSAPLDRVDESVRDVSTLSTLEVAAASLQSIGAWRGLLVYSALAGVIGAYGVIFDVVYVLVAAMLVNPMGAPAIVSVIGIAIGNGRMFARGGLRFAVSLLVQAAAALALGLVYGLSVSTPTMEQVTALSAWGVVLAFAAGAAGAQTQIRSERDSLVSGTAAGFMVAAALAPPAAVLGLSIALGRWDYLMIMAFLLPLQFVAIAAGGWITLHFLGMRPSDPSVARGNVRWRNGLAAVVCIAVTGMVIVQQSVGPRLRKADLSRTALEIAREAVDRTAGAHHVESSARFTRPRLQRYPGETLLFEIIVESGSTTEGSVAGELESSITDEVRRLVREQMPDVTPLVRVTVLTGPSAVD